MSPTFVMLQTYRREGPRENHARVHCASQGSCEYCRLQQCGGERREVFRYDPTTALYDRPKYLFSFRCASSVLSENSRRHTEVGSIGGEEDGVVGKGEVADPKECKMIADLGVDFLAAGIGNIHGKYPENWEGLDFNALDAIQQETGKLPLVLHGGTGIPEDMIKKAINLGVSKINVNTECQLYFQEATRKYIEAGKDLEGKGFDPRKLLAPGAAAIQQCVKEKMEIFGCIGKA